MSAVLISLSAFGSDEVRRLGQLGFAQLAAHAGADGVEVHPGADGVEIRGELLSGGVDVLGGIERVRAVARGFTGAFAPRGTRELA